MKGAIKAVRLKDLAKPVVWSNAQSPTGPSAGKKKGPPAPAPAKTDAPAEDDVATTGGAATVDFSGSEPA